MKEALMELMRPIWICVGVLVAIILSLVGFVIGVPSLLVYRFGRWLVESANLIIDDLD